MLNVFRIFCMRTGAFFGWKYDTGTLYFLNNDLFRKNVIIYVLYKYNVLFMVEIC
jgi:hypothetical protein